MQRTFGARCESVTSTSAVMPGALRAGGSAPNITALLLRESVALVSGQCGVPQWPSTTKLSRGVGEQRGRAGRPVF